MKDILRFSFVNTSQWAFWIDAAYLFLESTSKFSVFLWFRILFRLLGISIKQEFDFDASQIEMRIF